MGPGDVPCDPFMCVPDINQIYRVSAQAAGNLFDVQ
jgi:hypothetical protein